MRRKALKCTISLYHKKMKYVSIADCVYMHTYDIHLHNCTNLLKIKAFKIHLGNPFFSYNLQSKGGINATVNVTIKAV